jgi:two-component system chemotaxis response regulator CheB
MQGASATAEDKVKPAGTRELVVIGASAGGVETLRTVVAGLAPDLPAALCVVLHLSPASPSALAHILARAGRLPCRTAVHGELLRPGEILVAPPDHHLLVEERRVVLSVGPRENGHRPSVDTLFRSAAEALDGAVLGVVLTGTRDDGTAGLAAIHAGGGATLVQDPEEALYPGMPASALAHVEVDAVAPMHAIAAAITAMVRGEPLPGGVTRPPRPHELTAQEGAFTTICPECGGVLSEHEAEGLAEWRCRVGHRYSPKALADAQSRDIEAALWTAVRALEDRRLLLERMAGQLDERGHAHAAASFRRRGQQADEEAQAVRAALERATASALRDLDGEEAGEPAPWAGKAS